MKEEDEGVDGGDGAERKSKRQNVEKRKERKREGEGMGGVPGAQALIGTCSTISSPKPCTPR